MISRTHKLSITRQSDLLGFFRGCVYYTPRPISDETQAIMNRIDKIYVDYPFMGSRMMRDTLNREGYKLGRKRVRTMMKKMGIEALYQKPKTSSRNPAHKVYPYLLRGMTINRSNQVWATYGYHLHPHETGLRLSMRYC